MELKFNFDLKPGRKLSDRKILNDGEPLISIVTPYYNAEKFIEETYISIMNQTFPYWEWIIVNDGSTNENTDKVLSELSSRDNRIRVLNKENGGPAKARYYGVQNAKADIIFTIDADDLIVNTMLECGYFTLLTNPEATWAYTPIVTFGDNNYLYTPKFETELEKKENVVSVASFIRKQDFLDVTQYNEIPKEVHEDWFMWLTFLSKGKKPIRMNFLGFWYRRLDSGRLGSINADKAKTEIAESYLNPLRKEIKEKVGAIQFPSSSDYDFSSYPKKMDIGKPPINVKGEKKRILFMFPWTVLGGADIFNLNLIKALKREGYEITLITTEFNKKLGKRQEFEEYVDEYFDLTSFLNREDWVSFIYYLIKSRNIDMVFESNSYYGYYAIPWLKWQFPEVVFVDYLHAEDWSWRDGSYPRESVAVSRILDSTFTCTNYLKELMMTRMNRQVDNIQPYYIGTDSKHFDPDIKFEEDEELKKKYAGKKVILYPTRVVYLKRPLFMVQMMKKLVEKDKNVVCVVVGDGPALGHMKEEATYNKVYEYFDFVGEKKDLRPYYKIADVTIVCSLTEGLTLTAYESFSMATPVISSDVGGQKELITPDCGIMIDKYQSVENDMQNFNYDPEEVEKFADAVDKIVHSQDYDKMCKNCRDRIVNEFDFNIQIGRLVNKLSSMIDEKSKVGREAVGSEELAERLLILFNECTRRNYNNPDKPVNKKEIMVAKLWNHGWYRGMVKFFKKTGINRAYKKIRGRK